MGFLLLALNFNCLSLILLRYYKFFKKNIIFSNKITGQIEDIRGIAHTYNNLALIYQEMEETEKAIEHYLKSIVELTKIGDSRSLAQAHNNLALIYQQNENWEDAYTYHQHSLNEKEKNDDQKGLAQTYKNLGMVCQAKREWGATIEYYQKALQLRDHLSTSDVQKIFINLGIAYQELGENDLAVDALEKAIKYAAEDSELDLLAQTYGNLGVALYEKKEFRPAIRLLNQVLFYYLKQDALENVKKVSRVFYRIQTKMADKEFNQLADQELNRIIADGIWWKDRQILTGDEAKEILKQMKEPKQQRRTESEREAEEGEKV
ncbi:MAG TPA: tetratricopeptide repeat protein [bacterium]|nr:tetratricopeptide repeat protein [bacterium]